jgi:transglutaminase-like putative cysteine protease
MTRSLKWLLVGACALVCAGAAVGLVLTLSGSNQPAAGKPQISIDVVVVPEVMPAVYKIYSGTEGNFLAKTVIKNNGSTPVTNFHISYKIPGYVETAGQEDYPIILPGETVNDYCYPTFDADQMAGIHSQTRAELDVNYTYDGGTGVKGTSKFFAFLGHNDWIRTQLPQESRLTFSDGVDNAPMLAAFVTKDDPTVNKVAKQLTPGIFTATDSGTWDAVYAVYNAIRDARYRYITESSAFWTQDAQEVQLPSETLANGAGNCVDLSVLFSSMLEAVGVKTYLCLSTGHCQFGFQLPESGEWYVVEETMVDDPNATLDDSLDSAYKWYGEQTGQNTWVRVDVEQAWAEGMVPSW